MATKNRGIVRRISPDLDIQIRELTIKNNLKYVDGSKEAADLLKKLRGKKLFKEINF